MLHIQVDATILRTRLAWYFKHQCTLTTIRISNIRHREDDRLTSEVCPAVWAYIYKVVRRCSVVTEVLVAKLVNCTPAFVANINTIHIDGEDEGIIVRCVGLATDTLHRLWLSYSNDTVIRTSIIRSNCCDRSDTSTIRAISNRDYDRLIFVAKDSVRSEGEWLTVRTAVRVATAIYSCPAARSIQATYSSDDFEEVIIRVRWRTVILTRSRIEFNRQQTWRHYTSVVTVVFITWVLCTVRVFTTDTVTWVGVSTVTRSRVFVVLVCFVNLSNVHIADTSSRSIHCCSEGQVDGFTHRQADIIPVDHVSRSYTIIRDVRDVAVTVRYHIFHTNTCSILRTVVGHCDGKGHHITDIRGFIIHHLDQ